jgi:hypothetical protein
VSCRFDLANALPRNAESIADLRERKAVVGVTGP